MILVLWLVSPIFVTQLVFLPPLTLIYATCVYVGCDVFQSGQVLAWKVASSDGSSTNPFEAVATLESQSHGIVCLVVKDKKLFSGSINGTMTVTDITTLKSLMSMRASNSAVTSMSGCLISSSMDGTVNAWRETGNGLLQICYTHQEEKGVIALIGMNINGMTPGGARRGVLLVSCIDNCVRLYELPSFKETGRVYAKTEVRALRAEDGLGGLFFPGDGSSRITIGKLASSTVTNKLISSFIFLE